MRRALLAALAVFCTLLALPFARANPDSPGAAMVAAADPEASTVDPTVYGDGSGFGDAAAVDEIRGTLAAPEHATEH